MFTATAVMVVVIIRVIIIKFLTNGELKAFEKQAVTGNTHYLFNGNGQERTRKKSTKPSIEIGNPSKSNRIELQTYKRNAQAQCFSRHVHCIHAHRKLS